MLYDGDLWWWLLINILFTILFSAMGVWNWRRRQESLRLHRDVRALTTSAAVRDVRITDVAALLEAAVTERNRQIADLETQVQTAARERQAALQNMEAAVTRLSTRQDALDARQRRLETAFTLQADILAEQTRILREMAPVVQNLTARAIAQSVFAELTAAAGARPGQQIVFGPYAGGAGSAAIGQDVQGSALTTGDANKIGGS